jgi:hypothetical protein
MNKIILLAVSIILATSTFAQNQNINPVKKNEIGIHAGAVTGLGFSYRHWFNKYGFQFTGVPLKTDNTEIYSISLTALYSFYDTKYLRVFGYFGNHYFYDKEYGDNQPWKDFGPKFTNDDDYDSFDDNSYFFKESYSFGFGPGFAFGKTVRFNLMIGYAFYDIFDTFQMYPTGELGVYYRF